MIIPIGVTTKKKIIPIINGDTIDPKMIPNLNHNLLSGVKNLEFIIPKIKKAIDKIKDHNLKSPWDFKGHKAIIKKTMKNKTPKLLFDEVFISLFKLIYKTLFIKMYFFFNVIFLF